MGFDPQQFGDKLDDLRIGALKEPNEASQLFVIDRCNALPEDDN
jgi:hypothetical protein